MCRVGHGFPCSKTVTHRPSLTRPSDLDVAAVRKTEATANYFTTIQFCWVNLNTGCFWYDLIIPAKEPRLLGKLSRVQRQ